MTTPMIGVTSLTQTNDLSLVESAIRQLPKTALAVTDLIQKWRGRDGNDPSGDIAKDAAQRF